VNWRQSGQVSYELWRSTILAAGGPADLASRTAYDAAGDLSALCLAMLAEESSFGTAHNRNTPDTLNPLNLRPRGGDGYQRFASYAEGIAEWRARLLDPGYAYTGTTDILSLVSVFAPASDSNDPAAYAAHVLSRLAAWGVQESPMPTKPTILVIAGHRSYNDTGNPDEKALTPALARSYRDAFRAAGYDCTWLQEADGDTDPDDTVGWLDTVSQKAAQWLARQPGDCILLDLHYEGSPARGCFAIIPDVTGLRTAVTTFQDPADTWENNVLDRQLARSLVDGIVNRTGLPLRQGIREPGLMDESQTGVGGQGWRLATFAYTSPYRAKAVRLVVEHGNHTHPQDAAIIARSDFSDLCAAAAVNAVLATYGGEVVDPTPTPPPAPTPSPIWWTPGAIGPQRRAHDGAVALAMLGEVKAKRNVPVRRDADSKSPVVDRISKGETRKIVGTYRGSNRWVFVEVAPGQYGRALWSAFYERFPTT